MTCWSCQSFGTMAKRTLGMLLQSGLPKGIGWKAYAAARVVTQRPPTKKCQGYMSPLECVPGSVVPTHK